MKKGLIIIYLLILLILTLCSCFKQGPYPPDLRQSSEQVVQVDLVDARSEAELYHAESYSNYVLYTIPPEETAAFMEQLLSVEFYLPGYEPARHLGKVAFRIYYADGSSDYIGSNATYFRNSKNEYAGLNLQHPDQEAFFALFGQYVDVKWISTQ